MTIQSFKSLYQDGTLKKTDLFRVAHADLVVEPGFNLRLPGADLDEHVAGMTKFILDGGQLPPLEVRVTDDGKVVIVDGHCRHAAYGKAIEAGAEIEWINVLPFRGNDVDRVARIITSASGRHLSLLETAFGYKRLAAFNMTPDAIAAKFNKTRQHVDQALILANGNADVHALVAAGTVAATVAIDAVRKHGEGAGAFLAEAANAAKAGGKKKVTAGTVNGKSLPKKTVTAMVDLVANLHSSLTKEAAETLATLTITDNQVSPLIEVDARALFELLDVHREISEIKAKHEAKQREAAAKNAQGELIA